MFHITPSLEAKIKGLTEDPGVYLMKDAQGSILYVGKAKNLKNRVSNYFKEDGKADGRGPRIELLVRKIDDFEVILTDNEIEALILEFNLIKKHRPRFNVRLKDDKSYPYVRLDLEHPYPRLEYVRRAKKDGARYFGPYVSSYQIRDMLQWAQKAFKLRDCSDNEFRNRARPCILYQMGQCSAPCVQKISTQAYAHDIQTVLKILDGKSTDVVRDLKAQMHASAEAEDFEQAARFRDRIQMLEEIHQEQKITDPESQSNRDMIHFARSTNAAVLVNMLVRDGKTVSVLQYPFEEMDPIISDVQFLFEFLAQYYLRRHEESPQVLPEEVLLPSLGGPELDNVLLEQTQVLARALGRRIDFRIPKRGEAVQLLSMVKKTADYHLGELTSLRTHSAEDLEHLKYHLDLKKYPRRIECYDISHFQGEGTVASRVVFIEGRPEKKFYRHYHVQEVYSGHSSEIDDYRSMREILERRFTKGLKNIHDRELPDLVVVDGGKGQLAQAQAVFEELAVTGVELCSIAKARTERDFEQTQVLSSMERIFKPNQKNPILLKPGTGAFRILTQARDEAHRFAITFQRKTLSKRRFKRK